MKRVRAFIRKVVVWTIIPLTILIAVYFLFFRTTEVSYIKPEVITNEVVKEIDPLDPKYEERKAQLEDRYRKIAELEARVDVNETEIQRLNEENKSLRAELADFMTATE